MCRCPTAFDFYPRPPRGGRRRSDSERRFQHRFLSTPSARRATASAAARASAGRISIHALREEGDALGVRPHVDGVDFYPRPPRGGRPRSGWSSCRSSRISIHALREEGDKALADELATRGISIHALREEGDCPQTASQPQPFDFYPRPPRGGRPRTATKRASSGRFLSTPSARRATSAMVSTIAPPRFLSTPSARRATWAKPT